MSEQSPESTVAGLHMLKKHGVTFQPNIVVTTMNLATLADTVLFLHTTFSPTGIFVSRATKPSNAAGDFTKLLLNNAQLEEMFHVCAEMGEQYRITMKTCGAFPYAYSALKRRSIYLVCTLW